MARDDVDVRTVGRLRVDGQRERACREPLRLDLAGAVLVALQLLDSAHIDVEAGDAHVVGKGNREWQADIAKPHHHYVSIGHLLILNSSKSAAS